jgi:hypothetical protein
MLQRRERAGCCGDVGTGEERVRMDEGSQGFAGVA